MKSQKTKARILKAAIRLFNLHGIKNVRLQHIADEALLSVGNLAYHFPDKKQILKGIEETVSAEVRTLLSDWQQFPHFIDFDNQLSKLYHLINTYPFYFLDILELKRTYPKIHEVRREQILQMIREIRNWLQLHVNQGMLNQHLEATQLEDTAEMLWFIMTFWMAKNEILDIEDTDERAFKAMVWAQLKPLLSEKGQMEFEFLIQPAL